MQKLKTSTMARTGDIATHGSANSFSHGSQTANSHGATGEKTTRMVETKVSVVRVREHEIALPRRPSLLSRLSSAKSAFSKAFSAPPTVVYEAGNDNTDPAANPATETGLLKDIKALDFDDYETLLQFLYAETKGVENDDDLLLERLIQLLSKLPPTSVHGKELTDGFVATLWNGITHPPITSLGSEFKYRSADGRNNSIYMPGLGAANTPYSKLTRPLVFQRPDQPDPGLVFDLLMDRGEKFEPHPNGISSVLFYLASIIIHDIFQTVSAPSISCSC
jgi:hypothetical protein